MLGADLSLHVEVLRPKAGIGPLPITTLVIEGDSQSGGVTPGVYDAGLWSFRWKDAHPAPLTVHVVAQGSRTVGGAAYAGPPSESADTGTPAGNTLLAHSGDDLALASQLIAVMIGSNDLGAYSVAAFLAHLAEWAAPIRAAGVKIALASPPRFDSRHPNHATFNAGLATYLTTIRADWADYVDAYIPFGEHPDIDVATDPHPLLGDGVHLTGFDAVTPGKGQNLLFEVMSAVLNSAVDETRNGATSPYPGDWFGANPTVNPGDVVERRYLVTGLGLGVTATCSLSSAVAATMRRGAGSFGTASFTVMNGDVVTLRLPASASYSTAVSATVTIGTGSDTLTATTTANVTPATYAHQDVVSSSAPGTTYTFNDLVFGNAGIGVFGVAAAGAATSLKVDGVAVTLEPAASISGSFSATLTTFTAPGITAGTHDIEITFAGWTGQVSLSYGVVEDADPTIQQRDESAPASQSAPHTTGALTVPANGVAVAFFGEYGGASITPATANTGTTLIDEGNGTYNSETFGIAVGTRSTSGAASFNFAFGTYPRVALVFKAAGT